MVAKRVSASAVEHVVTAAHPTDAAQHIPRIHGGGTTGSSDDDVRPFRPDDMPRVLDYEGMPPPPEDCVMLHGEAAEENNNNNANLPEFPERVVVLRGAYLFYYDPDDVDDDDDGTNAHSDDKYVGPPLGVIPLDRVVVEFPPGGRRVFREHAPTDARNGYEMLVRHRGEVGGAGGDNGDGNDSDGSEEDVLSGFRRPGGASASGGGGATTSIQRPSTREPIEMLPRPPESRTITTRSRSPSFGNENDCSQNSQNNEDNGLTFLGLKNLVPSDRFNEYVLGRSVKVRCLTSAS